MINFQWPCQTHTFIDIEKVDASVIVFHEPFFDLALAPSFTMSFTLGASKFPYKCRQCKYKWCSLKPHKVYSGFYCKKSVEHHRNKKCHSITIPINTNIARLDKCEYIEENVHSIYTLIYQVTTTLWSTSFPFQLLTWFCRQNN